MSSSLWFTDYLLGDGFYLHMQQVRMRNGNWLHAMANVHADAEM